MVMRAIPSWLSVQQTIVINRIYISGYNFLESPDRKFVSVNFKMSRKIILSIFTVLTTLSESNCGLMDIFNMSSDYNLASTLDIMFALTRNDIGMVLSGDITTPIEEDVTFWCGNRYTYNHVRGYYYSFSHPTEILQSWSKHSLVILIFSKRLTSANQSYLLHTDG